MNKLIRLTTFVVVLIVIFGGLYWWYFLRTPVGVGTDLPAGQNTGGFAPFSRTPTGNTGQGGNQTGGATTTEITGNIGAPIPVLRQLSTTPVGGFGASTTASTTVVRWVDRGRGNIYEARMDDLNIETISNTLLPRVYESWWGKNDTSFIGQYLDGESDLVTTVIANIVKRVMPKSSTTTGTSTASTSVTTQTIPLAETPYELKGRVVSGNIIAVAESPKRDRILTVINEGGVAIGYVSNFDGSRQARLFSLPFTQLIAEWPEENTVAVTTKASANYAGYLYLINIRSGTVRSVLGNLPGLTTKVSKDAARVLYSYSGNGGKVATAVYDISEKESEPVIFRTLADKCVWSAKFKEQVYCGVSSQTPNAKYPDDWYLGRTSFIDSIWMLDTDTGEVRQVADLLNQGNAIIDAYNLALDESDEYLFFMNKNDLSLWSLDLISSN